MASHLWLICCKGMEKEGCLYGDLQHSPLLAEAYKFMSCGYFIFENNY